MPVEQILDLPGSLLPISSRHVSSFDTAVRHGEIRGFELPRIGIGYRVAGVLSGWRLVLGDPF